MDARGLYKPTFVNITQLCLKMIVPYALWTRSPNAGPLVTGILKQIFLSLNPFFYLNPLVIAE